MPTESRRNYLVGNDIVSLSSNETLRDKLKSKDPRFLMRVFSDKEQGLIKAATNPEEMLWTLWSAKEASFKIIKKLNPAQVFAHKKFEVTISNETRGFVLFNNNIQIILTWQKTLDYIHCIGVQSPQPRTEWLIARTTEITNAIELSAQEEDSVYSEESRKVRTLAKRLLLQCGFTGTEVIRERLATGGFLAPKVIFNMAANATPNIDISLSHDGPWLAAVIMSN